MTEHPTVSQIANYTARLLLHLKCVREAGESIGVSSEQLAMHDLSKWSPEEFPAYAMRFGGDEPGQDQTFIADRFAVAWLHHIHHNPHHWQSWIFPDGFSPKGSSIVGGICEMPSRYALEMIADWAGSSVAYTGSPDMTGWLYDNMPKIHLHPTTADYLRGVLGGFGYADVVYGQQWGHEL